MLAIALGRGDFRDYCPWFKNEAKIGKKWHCMEKGSKRII
jgi:hypothetical protein